MLSHYNALMQCIDWLYSAMKVTYRRKTGLIDIGMFHPILIFGFGNISSDNLQLSFTAYNKNETSSCFIQLNQKLTSDCLMTFVFLPVLTSF